MEPGQEDREDADRTRVEHTTVQLPQWSPVRKTGKTSGVFASAVFAAPAAMEPGQEDREDVNEATNALRRAAAAMEPGQEDREDRSPIYQVLTCGVPACREHCPGRHRSLQDKRYETGETGL